MVAAYDDSDLLCLNNLHAGNLKDANYDLRFIVAVLNSKLLNRFYRLISLESGRALAQTDIETIEQLPIPVPDQSTQSQISQLVDEIRELILKQSKLKPELQGSKLQRTIQVKNTAINELVYQLYGITNQQRKLTEEAMGSC